MKAINYTAKVLSNGHISLPNEIREKMGLAVNSVVRVTLERDVKKENAIKAFGI
jgi:bifunctional DNA-binding transcriptional regulator/antitoxin component of YhaV-PrlF toxin-antitoxin module